MTPKRIVVIGGGISGLSAAWTLINADPTLDVKVLEGSARFGGKIQTTAFAGKRVDTGADAFLARVPEGIQLCRELGLESELVAPASSGSLLWSRDELHRFPSDTLLGIPSDIDALATGNIISPEGIERARQDLTMPGSVGREETDPSVGALVGARLGTEIVERLVDPLVGGINAGNVAHLSAAAATPQIAAVARMHASLIAGAHDLQSRRFDTVSSEPVFYSPIGGMQTIVDALIAQLRQRHVTATTETVVTSIERRDQDWSVSTEREAVCADAIVVATPAPQAAALLKQVAARASDQLSAIPYATVAMIRLAYAANAIPIPLDASGFVIPAVEKKLLTACSWSSSKWHELHSDGQVILRASAGRFDDHRAEQFSDQQLVDAAHLELNTMMRIRRPPQHADVTRWPASFPQYTPGHQARVEIIEQDVSSFGTLALAGAAYAGLGVPACIRSGRSAANTLLKAFKR